MMVFILNAGRRPAAGVFFDFGKWGQNQNRLPFFGDETKQLKIEGSTRIAAC